MGEGDRARELFQLINPINHADTREKIEQYKVEPYVIAADIYSLPSHLGRGGWTWYTGSSGWMYRLGVEAILGLHVEAGKLRIDPCIPGEWKSYRLIYRNGNTKYTIRVENPNGQNRGVSDVMMDGEDLPEGEIPLLDDGEEHSVRVILGKT
jgi:cyclic beta-1,2-glucan synthetase